MYIKLNYSSDKNILDCIRTVDDIINNPSVTSVGALSTRISAAPYGAGITTGLTTATSEIYRTVSPSVTKSHFFATNLSTGQYKWTLQFGSYDNTATNYYIQLQNVTTTLSGGLAGIVGNSITGGTITSSTCAITLSNSNTGGGGTDLTVAGTTYGSKNASYSIVSAGSGQTNVRTFWCYINDKCIIMSVTAASSFNNGWGSTYSDSTKQGGPYIFSQYTRFDYHNTDANGIIPLIFSDTGRGAGRGFGTAADYNGVNNILYPSGSADSVPLLAYNMVNALPAVTSAWPIQYVSVVVPTLGFRETSMQGANDKVAGTAATAAAVTVGKAVASAAAERFPNANLSGTSFQFIPLGWTSNRYGNTGGNASDKGGFYLFCGDYQPGDELTLNGKTWSVWPLWAGYADRLGLAIPKE
jgi:hypothetical protein